MHEPNLIAICSRISRTSLGLALAGLLLVGCQASTESRIEEIKSLHEQGKVEESIPLIQALLDEQPSHPEANFLLGVSHVSLRQAALAVWSLRKAAESDDPVAQQAGLLLANLLAQSKDYEEALRIADKVVEGAPTLSSARLIRAQVLQEMGRQEDALADTSVVLNENPEDYNALLMNTALLAELERYDEAEAQMVTLHELAERDVPSKAPNTCIAMASFQDEFRKNTEGARDQALRCLESYPDAQLVLNWAIALSDRLGEPEAADEILEAATDRAPENLELWRLRAGRLLQAGNEAGGDELLLEAAELWDTPQGWNLLAEYRTTNGREEDAIEALDRGLAAAGDEPAMAHERAELLVTAQRFDEALVAADELGDGPQRDFVRARIFAKQGRSEEALAAYEAGLIRWPNNSGARFSAGFVAETLGLWDTALEHYREASRAEAGHTDAALRMADILLQQGEYGAASSFALRHAQNRQGSGQLYIIAGLAALKSGDPEEARGIYEELVAGRMGLRLEALQGLALVARETDGPAAAVEVIEKGEVDWSDPASQMLLRLALDDLGKLGEHDEAERWIDRAIGAQGPNAELLELRARVQLRAGKKLQAATGFGSALALDEQYGPALAGQGTLEALDGDQAKAIALFDHAAEVERPDLQAAYMAAQLTQRSGDKAGAETRLREVVRMTPGNALACNDLAWILAEEKRDLELATDLAKRAVRIRPSATTYDTLGAVYLARSRETLAANALRKALVEDEQAAGSRYRLALALEQQGKPDEALGQFRTAVAQGGFAEIEDARTRLTRLEKSEGATQ